MKLIMMLVNIPASSSPQLIKLNQALPIFTPATTPAAFSSNPTTTTKTLIRSTNHNSIEIVGRKTRRRRRRGSWAVLSSSSDNQTVVSAPTTTSTAAGGGESPSLSASEVVRNFYGGINGHDLASVEGLIAHNCVYEDLIFSRPFVGRKAILEFFQKFIDSISMDLQFVIDDISDEDTSALGVTWHLEWKGKAFPFSKGCSFYRLDVVNGKRQIIYGRDIVEPTIKPGEVALVAIRGVTWLLQQFPQLADRL